MTNPSPAPKRDPLDRLLSLFSTVQSGEGVSAVLLALNIFILLALYYVLRTIREPLILNTPGGAEIKSYSSAGQAALFLLVVPLYGAFASRVNRLRLISWVTLFFILNLLIFAQFGSAGFAIGVPYYIWLGVFNMLMVAQFWGFANDLYSEEQGKRLFPIVGVGASLGAWIGALIAKYVYRPVGPFRLMVACAAALGLCILLTLWIHRREAGRAAAAKAKEASQPLEKRGGFQLILKSRYLLYVAILVFLLNWVNTLGGYLLDTFLTVTKDALPAAERGPFLGEFYGDYLSKINLLGFLFQTFLVSRLFKWIGVRGALFILPCIALGGYSILAVLPLVGIVKVAKILENSTDYSINNTVRHALYLPTAREAKYKAKAATDTFFVRSGDLMQAGVVYVGTSLGFSIANFAVVNIVLVVAWLGFAVLIYREHKRLTTIA